MAKNDAKMSIAVGLMSGTSCDGVDAALIETDGTQFVRPLASVFRPYSDEEQGLLRQALVDARDLKDRTARPGALAKAEDLITEAHKQAVESLLASDKGKKHRPDVIGFHGQTVWHDPANRLTVQIGDGQALADAFGLPVVHDFRAADVALGGQGAPLVPVYHSAIQQQLDLPLPIAFVNIGGVANITFIGASGMMIAFDCGPGNALINDFVREKAGLEMDEGGKLARAGTIDYLVLATIMADPYFRKPAPKSLDRNAFDMSAVMDKSLEDGAATLAALTAETIALGLEHMEQLERHPAEMVVICGGGQHNQFLMDQLRGALDMPVMPADDLGWKGDTMEAEAFGYLAVRSQLGLPLTYPGTTGVAKPTCGGVLAEPSVADNA
ncbi:anhydro-N-acetylmuramic acid kinase [Cohaesibacter sp. CAU 1516]|uniref:anhydro-N-acetylmuramic acid kinase n=1 Tax=Cohaesibacter sp. CAU 1516 TaxID=2576038 RepID=UPI001FED8F44|nr:anhydro-N-acetylmuramic acid kinase [Cohaesibacter sp. CAU 1516]